MRGKVHQRQKVGGDCGITPACAGKRVGGAGSVHLTVQSPPRVRGKERHDAISPTVEGITPACAGKSLPALLPYLNRLGSPPRVRGKVHASTTLLFMLRITPACAGKSQISPPLVEISGDHPRVCGEKNLQMALGLKAEGSPPRVRGKELEWRRLLSAGRITPACAGKSFVRNIIGIIG